MGRTILETFGQDVRWKSIARAAAGSDARMSGCSLPVIIISGSGNQGMTCSLPVIEYARSTDASHEKLLRALCISNLTAQDQKRYIGPLSAYCGAVCAAAGAGAGITYLCGGTAEQIENTVINTIVNAGGITCDGAKPSCAAKIFSSLQAAFLGHSLAMKGFRFEAGEGLAMDTAEDTVKAIGYMGREGMRQTDIEILNMMIGKTDLSSIDIPFFTYILFTYALYLQPCHSRGRMMGKIPVMLYQEHGGAVSLYPSFHNLSPGKDIDIVHGFIPYIQVSLLTEAGLRSALSFSAPDCSPPSSSQTAA